MKSEQFLRITTPGLVFGTRRDGRIEVIERTLDDDSVATERVVCDLSKFVTAFELPYVKVGQLTRCRVDLLMRDVTMEAEVERFLVKTFKPRRRILRVLRRLGDLNWRVREWVRRGDIVDVTSFGARGRSYTSRRRGA